MADKIDQLKIGDTSYDIDLPIDATPVVASLQTSKILIPTSSGGTTFGVGADGKVLKSNGTTVYWGDDNNTTYTIPTSLPANGGNADTVDGEHAAAFLHLSGGTMTGNLNLLANQYDRQGALNCNNSDIMGVNSIYTQDLADNTAEGIRFYRDASHYDSLTMSSGEIYFMPNDVAAGTAFSSAKKVLHTGKLTNATLNTAAATKSTSTNGGLYAVELDKNGQLAVRVPWVNTQDGNDNTAHSHAAEKGISLSDTNTGGISGTVTYKASLVNETVASNAASYTAGGSSKFYAVQLDKDSKLGVYVPWDANTDHYDWTDITNKPINFITNSSGLSSNGWKTLGGRSAGSKIAISYCSNSPASWNSGSYSASLVFGCSDTKGLLDCAYSTPTFTIGGGNAGAGTDTDPVWYMKISGTNGTAYNLDNFKTTDNNSAHSHAAEKGIALSDTNTGGTSGTVTYKAALVNETANTAAATRSDSADGGLYAVELDKNGKLAVRVPWVNTQDGNDNSAHTHEAGTGLSLSDASGYGTGGTSGKVKYILKSAATGEIGGIKVGAVQASGSTAPSYQSDSDSHKYYKVKLDVNGVAYVDIPWYTDGNDNTTYTIATGDSNGQIKVTPSSGNAYNVSVKGLGSAAYTNSNAYAASDHSHDYLPLSGGTLYDSGSDCPLTIQSNSDSYGAWIEFAGPNNYYGSIGVLDGGPYFYGASATSSVAFILEGDSRLTDSRSPTSHTHGNINNSGRITATESTTTNVKHIAVCVDDNGTVKKMTPANIRTVIGAGTSSLTLGGNGSATTAAKSDHYHTSLGSPSTLFTNGDLGTISAVPFIVAGSPLLVIPEYTEANTATNTLNANAGTANVAGWAFLPNGGLASKYIDINDDIGIVLHGPVTVLGQLNQYLTDYDEYVAQNGLHTTSFSYDAWMSMSDRSLKENIVDTDLDIDSLLSALHIVDFNFKADPEKRHTLGIIAQDLQEVLPEKYKEEFITTMQVDNENYSGIRDQKLAYLALLALQKQKKKIEDLEARLAKLENKD